MTARNDELEIVKEVAKRHNMFLMEGDSPDSEVISIIGYSDDFSDILRQINTSLYKVRIGESENSRYILSKNILSKQKILFKPLFSYKLTRIKMFCFVIIVIHILLQVLLNISRKFLTNEPFTFNGKNMCNLFFFDKSLKVLSGQKEEDTNLNEFQIRGNVSMVHVVSSNLSTWRTKVLVTIPVTNGLFFGFTSNDIIHDIAFNKSQMTEGELETDESERQSVKVVYSSSRSIEVILPDKKLIITSPNICKPSYFYMYRNSSFVMYEILSDLNNFPKNIEGIHAALVKMYNNFQYDAIGLFTQSNEIIATIDYISSDESLMNVCKEVISNHALNVFGKPPEIMHIHGVKVMSKKVRIGRRFYYSVGILKKEKCIFEGTETIFAALASYLFFIYNIFISNLEDSKTLNRIGTLLKCETRYTLMRFIGKTKDSITVLNTRLGNQVNLDENMMNEINKLNGSENCCKTIHASDDKWYIVTTMCNFDEVLNSYVQSYLFEDVTADKNDELRLKSAKTDLHIISQIAGFFKLKNETTCENDSFSYELGYDRPTNNLLELVYPYDVNLLDNIGKRKKITCRFKSADGKPRWYSIISTYENNIFKGFITRAQELTTMRHLTDSSINLNILSAASDIFALFSLDTLTGEVISALANERFCARSIDDIINNGDAANKAKIKNAWQRIKENNAQQISFQGRSTTPNGEMHWYNYTFERTSADSAILLILTIDDAKELSRKLIEAKTIIDLAFFHSNITSWTFNDDSDNELVATSKSKSYESARWNWSSIEHNVSSDFIPLIKKTFMSALETGKPFEVEVSMIIDKMRWVLIRGQRTSDKNTLCGVYFDLTELRENELLLEQKKTQALEATNAKSNFLANMSHEIRTPLNGMFSMLELLMVTNLDAEKQEMMEIVRSSFSKLLDLLNDTLDIAKIDQGKMTASPTTFSPLEIIEPILLEIPTNLSKKNIKTRIVCPPDFPLLCYGDPHFLLRIIHNIFTNALKFTEKGSVTIICSHTDDSITISIKDTGIGIPESKTKTIFEVFTQLDSSIKRPYGGSGIGLTLVTKLLDLIDGKISVESTVGVGSTFTTVFPYPTIYVPFLPRGLKENKDQIFFIDEKLVNPISLQYDEFYGYTIITDKNQVTDRIKFVVTPNEEQKYNEAREYKKKYPNILIVVYLTSSKRIQIQSGDIISSLPLKPTVMRNVLLSQKLKAQKNESKPLTPPRVLAADDVPTNRFAMDKILTKIDCPHVIVENGKEVIEKLEKEHFDVILLDKNMPVMNGPEAARIIRASKAPYANIPIIAMTASSLDEEKKECLDAGMNLFVTKPITISKLHKLLIRSVE